MFVGPNIVTDGLVAVFDAGSTRSYPGTGTVWYNLIGTVNGTLSATSIGTTTAGTMTFDGVDDSIDIPLASLASTNFTVIGVTQRTNAASGRIISAKNNNWLLGQWSTQMRQYYAQGWVTGAGAAGGTTTDDLNTHIWCGTGDISGDTYKLRDDNVDYTEISTGGSQGPNGFVLGKYAPGNSEYAIGTITVLLVYNRVLTDAEIDQNFNAQKTRFL
ncbi:LamG domain-containing protein [Pseudomonadales bacterium]|nr:LamG domain-containing protein [Pseudomonadales bacterium]